MQEVLGTGEGKEIVSVDLPSLVIPGGVLLLSYLGITLRKTSVCGWELLGNCCQGDFIFL